MRTEPRLQAEPPAGAALRRAAVLGGFVLACHTLVQPGLAQSLGDGTAGSGGAAPVAPAPGIGGILPGGSGPGGFGTWGPATGPVGLAPDAGSRPGTIGFPFSAFDQPWDPAQAAGEPTRAVNIQPSVAVDLIYNDNIDATARNKRDDLIVRITPAVLINLDSTRFQGTFSYAPQVEIYTQNSGENRVNQRFNAQGLATVVPGLFFVDARGSANVQTLSGGGGLDEDTSSSRDNLVQTYSFSVSPFAVYRFGSTATARAGYVMTYVNQDKVDSNSTDPFSQLPPDQRQFSFTPSEYTSHQFYGVVRTGEDFGKFAAQGTLSGTTFDGGGLYDGAYRNIALLETRYAVTPTIAPLAELGYETQRFNTVPTTDISGIVWALGVRLTPTPESVIIAKYGRRDGFNSFYLNGTMTVGARTRLFANYSERLTTSALEAGDLLSSTTLDPLGNPVDAMTGQPVVPSFANSTLGIQSGLARVKTGSVSASQSWLRDTFSLTLSHTERVPVADAPGTVTPGFRQESWSIGLSWNHDLSERARLTSFGSYSRTSSDTADDGNTYTAGTALTYLLSPTLVGSLSYRLRINDGGSSTGGVDDGQVTQNIITAGVRQSF